MELHPCGGCGRHIKVADAGCPFCGQARGPLRKTLSLVGGAVTTVVLAACYGVGAIGEDVDQDGWEDWDDCDDNNAAVNPGAAEDCGDSIDNDCDDAIDAADADCADTDTDTDT